jgi:hypothetical protein
MDYNFGFSRLEQRGAVPMALSGPAVTAALAQALYRPAAPAAGACPGRNRTGDRNDN